MLRIGCILFYLCLFGLWVTAENIKIDSILGANLSYDETVIKLLQIPKKQLHAALESQDYQFKDSVKIINALCWSYWYSEPEKAMKFATEELKMVEQNNYTEAMPSAYDNMAHLHSNDGKFNDALDYMLKSLKIKESVSDSNGISISLNGIGGIYFNMNNYEYAIKYWKEGLQIDSSLNNMSNVAVNIMNIGVAYSKNEEYDEALSWYFKSLNIYNDLAETKMLGSLYANIADIFTTKKEYDKALVYCYKSISSNMMEQDKSGLAYVYGSLAQIYSEMNDHIRAVQMGDTALAYARETASDLQLKNSYSMLSTIHENAGNYKKSVEYHKLTIELSERIYSSETAEQIANMQTKYETEKKEKENKILKQKNEISTLEINRQKITIYAGIGGLSLMIILAVVILRGYNQKKKAHALLAAKNVELHTKNIIIEDKNRDITDSIEYASSIQNTILPGDDIISNGLGEHFIFFQPRDIVSGDFYWFHEKEELIFIVAADCTGHGVPGAFVSILCNNILNQVIIEQDVNDAGEILTKVNKQVIKAFHKEGSRSTANDGMDCSLCVIRKKNRTVEFAGANNSLLLVRNGEIESYKADKTPIGGSTSKEFSFMTQKVQTNTNDMVYMFSDGFSDQFGGENIKKFKIKNFKQLLAKISSSPCTAQYEAVEKAFSAWKKNAEQIDDVLVVGFRV